MPIDPRITLGVQPVQLPMPDPNAGMNALARAMQIKSFQQEQQANAQKLERQNKLMELTGATYAKPEEREEALLRGGFIKESADLTKNRVDAAKVQADTDKNKVDAAHKRVDAWGQIMGYVRQNPTAENATAAVQHLVSMGVLPAEMGQQALAGLQANPNPQAIAQFADMGFRAALSVKDQLAKHQTNNIGGQTITQGIDPVTGKAALVSAVQNTQSPDNIATNARIAADNKASREQSERHFQENRNAPRGVVLQTEAGPMLVDPRTGTGVPVTGQDGQPLGKKDKPLSNAALKQLQEARDNAVTMDTLFSNFKDDFASKGVFGLGADASLATKAVIGADKDSVEWWKNYRKQAELVERHSMFGAALTPSEQASWRNADIGPGLDKEVIKRNLQTRAALTKKMLETTRQDLIDAGQSEQRVNAIAGRGPAERPATNTPKKISNDAEYNALPSGAEFIAPDGSRRRKP